MPESLPVIAGLASGIALIILFSVLPIPNLIPTTPQLTEDEAFDIMKSDIRSRVGDAVVTLYMRQPFYPDVSRPLPLIYYSKELGRQYNIDGKSHEIASSCVPSLSCPINVARSDIESAINGRLVYFLDGAYIGNDISSPAFYFIDAMNGDILWSDIGIGQDTDPEPREDQIAIPKYKAVVKILEGASIESSEEYMVPQTAVVIIGINNTVLWVNEDSVPHTITTDDDYHDPVSGLFDSRDRPAEEGGAFVMPQDTFEFTFTKPGVYHYHHEPHPWIQGTVVVLES